LESIQNILGTTTDSLVASIVDALANAELSSGIELINNAVDDGANPNQIARQIVSFLRGVLMCGTDNAGLVDVSSQTLSLMKQCEALLNSKQIVSCVQEFDKAARDNISGWQPQLALEIAFVNSTQNMYEKRDIKDSEPSLLSDDKDQPNAATKSSVEDDDKGISNPTTNGITTTELNILWKEIISSSRSSHHTLPALLEWCVPVRVDNDMVQIAVKEQFALSKLDKPEMIIYLQNAIMAASGHSLGVQFTLMDIGGSADESIDVSDDGAVAMGVELGAKVRERSLRRK